MRVAIIESDDRELSRYNRGMLSDWLQSALVDSGKSQAELARVLTANLGRSIDRAAVNKMVKGTRKIAVDELVEIERYLDMRSRAPVRMEGRRGLHE